MLAKSANVQWTPEARLVFRAAVEKYHASLTLARKIRHASCRHARVSASCRASCHAILAMHVRTAVLEVIDTKPRSCALRDYQW